jgi:hypothetical protein
VSKSGGYKTGKSWQYLLLRTKSDGFMCGVSSFCKLFLSLFLYLTREFLPPFSYPAGGRGWGDVKVLESIHPAYNVVTQVCEMDKHLTVIPLVQQRALKDEFPTGKTW